MKNALKRGFTLVELLVVVLIIGILSAVALPQYQKAVTKSRFTEAMSNLKTIGKANEVCFLEQGTSCQFDELSIEVGKEGRNIQSGGINASSVRHTNDFEYGLNDGHYNPCTSTPTGDTWAYAQYAKEDVCICYMKTGEMVMGSSEGCVNQEPRFNYAQLLNLPFSESCCCC